MSAFWKTTPSVPTPGYFTSSRISVDSTPDVGKHTTVPGKLPATLALCKSSAGSPSTLWDLVRDCSNSPRISFAILSVTQGLWGSVRQASEICNRDTHSPNPFTYVKHRCYPHPTRQWRPESVASLLLHSDRYPSLLWKATSGPTLRFDGISNELWTIEQWFSI